MAIKQIVLDAIKEAELSNAKRLYKKNPALFLALREFRKKEPPSLRKAVENIKKIDPKADVSVTNINAWKNQFPRLIKDNQLFRDYMELIGIDPEEEKNTNQKEIKAKSVQASRKTQKEKDDKLKKEMAKATIILSEMNQENLSDSKKWEISNIWRRQVDKINNAMQEWGIVKADWINELYNINWKLLAKGKEIILSNLSTIDVKHFWDLKALSDILDTAFKQNRLIDWKSTDNVAIGVHNIYDKIIANANEKRES